MTEIKDGHIGWRETAALIITFTSIKVLLAFPRMQAKLGLSAGWMIPVIATALGLLGFGLIAVLMKRFPGKSIVEVSETVAGKYLGTVISLGFFAFFFYLTVMVLRQFAETVITTTLPQTPISVITAIFLAAVVYAAYMGIETIARGNWLLFPFMLLGYVTILAGVLPYFNSDNFFPLLGTGPAEILKFGMLKSSLLGEVLVLAVILPALRDREKFTRIGLMSIMISGMAMTLAVVVLIGTFTPQGAKYEAILPLYQLARLIYFGRFVQRIEALFIFVWIFAGLVEISLSLYASAVILARILKLPVYRPLVFPLALLAYSLSFLPPDYVTATKLETEVLRKYGWSITFLLPGLLLLLARIRGIGENGRQKGGQEKGGGREGRRWTAGTTGNLNKK